MEDQVVNISVKKIYPPYLLLRMLDRKSLAYLELRDSIDKVGLLSSICVRPSKRRRGWYDIISGMWRWSCFKDLGITSIPAIIKDVDDLEVIKLQIMENAIRSKTNPCEYAAHIKRLFMADPQMTFSKLSSEIKKSPIWIRQMLDLLNLTEEISKRVDRSEIPLTSAYALAKLPKWLQVEMENDAVMIPAGEFVQQCQDKLVNYRQLKTDQKSNNFYKMQFSPHPYLQYFKTLTTEWEKLAVGPILLVKNSVTKPIDAWKLAIGWVLHLDKDSVKEQEKRAKERFEEMELNILKRKDERDSMEKLVQELL